jgi:hypothetical protein
VLSASAYGDADLLVAKSLRRLGKKLREMALSSAKKSSQRFILYRKITKEMAVKNCPRSAFLELANADISPVNLVGAVGRLDRVDLETDEA